MDTGMGFDSAAMLGGPGAEPPNEPRAPISRRARLIALVGALGAAALSVGLLGAGLFPGWPIVGGSGYCTSYVNSGGSNVCTNTTPAGPPALTGGELVTVDTGNLSGGVQTVSIPTGILGNSTNRIIGGDFTTNLWQRGTTPVSNATPTVALMTADRWWVISPSGTVDVLKTTPATSAADYLGGIGFYSGMEVRRHTGSTGALTCIGQTLDKAAAAQLIGNNAVFSFWGYAPSTYSATGSQITVSIAYFTAADAAATQAAIGDAGGNSSTFALSAAAQASGITGYQAATAGMSANSPGTVASGVATIALTTTPTRYAVYAPIPVMNSAGTYVTAVGISICGTFVASSAVTTDWFEIFGAQLEAKSSVATAQLPAGVISPSNFDRRPAATEQLYQQYYSYVVTESASAINSEGLCAMSTTSIANCLITFPATMRLAPIAKYTAGFEASATVASSSATVCTALTTSATLTGNAVSNKQVIVDCASSAGFGAAGTAGFLWDIGTGSATGVMQFSAEP